MIPSDEQVFRQSGVDESEFLAVPFDVAGDFGAADASRSECENVTSHIQQRATSPCPLRLGSLSVYVRSFFVSDRLLSLTSLFPSFSFTPLSKTACYLRICASMKDLRIFSKWFRPIYSFGSRRINPSSSHAYSKFSKGRKERLCVGGCEQNH